MSLSAVISAPTPPCLTGGGGVTLELLLVLGTGLGAALAARGFRARDEANPTPEAGAPRGAPESSPRGSDRGARS